MPWKNYQTAVFDLAIDTVTFNANIGDARIYGVESNIEYRPIHGLTLSLAGNYNDSVMTSNAYEQSRIRRYQRSTPALCALLQGQRQRALRNAIRTELQHLCSIRHFLYRRHVERFEYQHAELDQP